MAILTVGTSGQQFSTIEAAVTAANPGDTIEVQAGTYTDDFLGIYKNLTLQAVGGMVKMVETQDPPNGKAMIDEGGSGVSTNISGFDVSGVAVGDGNGAAIRYEGGNLSLSDVYFHNNQEGLLGAADPNGTISVDHSEFAFNGDGSGFTHNIYAGRIASLVITNSYFHDANEGHEIKSRAANTTITNDRIFDNNGTASYSIDIPNAGNATIQNDVIEQGPFSDNPNIIAYGEEGVSNPGTNVLIADNTIVNDLASSNAQVILNRSSTPLNFTDNQVYGTTRLVNGPLNASGTVFLTTRPILDTSSIVQPSSGPVPPSVPGGSGDDFNGDRTSDILFQNSNSGLLLDWQMANGTYSKAIPIAGASSDWKEIGTGDFNGDGTTDILFQNSNSGLLLDWQMANGTYSKAIPIAGASSDWKEIGTGDFNGDGTTDILFQNSNTGLLLDWQMANGTYSKAIPIAGASFDWKFIGTGDFNGDGTTDILFQNSNTGLLLDWQMANGTYSKAIPIAGASSDWKEIGTGDFNGDGTTDILFQNSNSGLLLDWQMANGTYSKAIPIAGASSDWRYAGAGDYNGDGTTDILFQNTNSGLLLDWQMADGTYSKAVPIAGAASDWKVLPA